MRAGGAWSESALDGHRDQHLELGRDGPRDVRGGLPDDPPVLLGSGGQRRGSELGHSAASLQAGDMVPPAAAGAVPQLVRLGIVIPPERL